MAKIRIGEGELLMAFEGGDGTMQWYLDRQIGEVIGLGDDFGFDLDDDEDDAGDEDDAEAGWEAEERALRRAINRDEEGRRYLPVPSLESHEGFRIMERFAASQDGRVRDALFDALDRRRPFRSFKDALMAFPDVRERWFAYHEERLREEVLAWLESEGIEAELTRSATTDRANDGLAGDGERRDG
ncbi:MAG: UPF0158 family protein [Longimicrobiaceae bacterium]